MNTVTDDDARTLVTALASVGGDGEQVRRLLLTLCESADRDELLVLALTALGITYAECLPHPIYPASEGEK